LRSNSSVDVLARAASAVPKWSTMHRVVDDEVDRAQRVDLLRVAAQRRHRLAHRGEVDHRRHAGEVLHAARAPA
jgi:hypothetical protein